MHWQSPPFAMNLSRAARGSVKIGSIVSARAVGLAVQEAKTLRRAAAKGKKITLQKNVYEILLENLFVANFAAVAAARWDRIARKSGGMPQGDLFTRFLMRSRC